MIYVKVTDGDNSQVYSCDHVWTLHANVIVLKAAKRCPHAGSPPTGDVYVLSGIIEELGEITEAEALAIKPMNRTRTTISQEV